MIEETIWLRAPGLREQINLSISAETIVNKATMDISSVLPDANCTTSPDGVQVLLNDSLLWEFNGPDYGNFGRQDKFLYGKSDVNLNIKSGGGSNGTWIRLMKNAKILNATMEAACGASAGGLGLTMNVFGPSADFKLGFTARDAGDLNGDGYDDLIIGSAAGHAYIVFGTHDMKGAATLDLNCDWGRSVDGVGDVNGDGYDDVIVWTKNPADSYEIVSLYYGGQAMDTNPDLNFSAYAIDDGFGASVAGIGDVNGDGFDDVAIGAVNNASNGMNSGCVYIYLGGIVMDSNPDVILTGEAAGDYLSMGSYGLAAAGDVNNDGYDDVIVGAQFNDVPFSGCGRAYVYFGGKSMDNISDVTIIGTVPSEWLGVAVSGAGDVNGDGFDDVIVGANGIMSAMIYYGSTNMDNGADIVLQRKGGFGYTASGAGDVNNDGYDDVIVGEFPYIHIFYGGQDMDAAPDEVLVLDSENFGGDNKLSSAGDVDRDGYDDLIVGQYANKTNGQWSGAWLLYTHRTGILEPNITLGQNIAWSQMGYFNNSVTVRNFAGFLNEVVSEASPGGTDEYGNTFVDIPIAVYAKCEGNISLRNLNITYTYKTTIPDFADKLNNYIIAHKSEQDAKGNLTIPIRVQSRNPGRVKLSNVYINLDEGPRLVQNIPDMGLKEDSMKPDLLDLSHYFKDDMDAASSLKFAIRTLTNSSFVNVTIAMGKYISADASTGPLNDNWTGEVKVIANCTNTRNQTMESNDFKIIVVNVNDPPIFTSTPVTKAIAGQEYVYQITAVDGDNDPIQFNLTKQPQNMTIDPSSGLINWIPPRGGGYEVTIEATDGQAINIQNYIIVVPNRPPRITDSTIPNAYVGVQFTYDIPAVDDDGNDLNFGLLTVLPGMTIEPSSGRITWIPLQPGDFPVSVRISNRKDTTIYNFTIRVILGNRNPQFSTNPILVATAGIPYYYNAEASDEDGDALEFSMLDGPAGMTINVTTGKVSWTPVTAGNSSVKLRASDGKGGEAFQEFTITVVNRTRPGIEFKTPSEGQRAKGRFAVTGTAMKGTLVIVKIQLRVDSGEWLNVSGNSTWTYTLDTTKLKDGKHILQARAFDGMDYSDIINRTMLVDNAKPAANGFIPGFDGVSMVAVLSVMALAFLRRKRQVSK